MAISCHRVQIHCSEFFSATFKKESSNTFLSEIIINIPFFLALIDWNLKFIKFINNLLNKTWNLKFIKSARFFVLLWELRKMAISCHTVVTRTFQRHIQKESSNTFPSGYYYYSSFFFQAWSRIYTCIAEMVIRSLPRSSQRRLCSDDCAIGRPFSRATGTIRIN